MYPSTTLFYDWVIHPFSKQSLKIAEILFFEQVPGKTPSNHRRIPDSDYWQEIYYEIQASYDSMQLLAGHLSLSIFMGKVEKNLSIQSIKIGLNLNTMVNVQFKEFKEKEKKESAPIWSRVSRRKKILRNSITAILGLISFISILFLISFLNTGQFARYIVYNNADIDDHKIFPSRELRKGMNTFSFFPPIKEKAPQSSGDGESFDDFLRESNTVAFLVIKNDTLLLERYFDGYEESSVIPSFSMAKAVTSILVGIAIDDGLIKSVDEPIVNYIPELKAQKMDKVTIKHLLQMTSGISFNESYSNPFGDAATVYYGNDLRSFSLSMELENEPGKEFNYISGNTQLLGFVLERALKGKTLTRYLEEKLWIPLGMEYDASWSLDRNGEEGMEKTFCCINARARDFAKIGRLYLNKGVWGDSLQIVSSSWVEESTKIDTTEGSEEDYQYQWWITSKKGDYVAEGILGQFIYVSPSENMVIVRMGRNEGGEYWPGLFNALKGVY